MATQAELQWINANPELSRQLFGSLNPPDGQVGNFVNNWYMSGDGSNVTPDDIDGAILTEYKARNPGSVSYTPSNQNQPSQGGGGASPSDQTNPPANQGTGIDPATGMPFDQALPWTVPNSNPQDTNGYGSPSNNTPTGGTPSGGTPAGGNTPGTTPWTPLVNGSGGVTTPDGFQQAPFPQGVGGNYQQVQNSVQSGQFNSQGTTNQNQQTESGQQTNQQQTGQQQTTGQSTQTTQAVDPYGWGNLLDQQLQQSVGGDADRTAWLQDVMQTGGQGFNSQVEQAVRQSLTGPQTTGAGDSARSRMAGYAAADVARNNMNQRLAASEQLAGPTGFTNLISQAQPFVGSTTTGESTSLTDTLNNLSSNSSGWQNLVNQVSENQSGTTSANASQAGAGNIPEGQPVKTGGCVLCTAAIELGLSNHRNVLRRVISHKLNKDWKRFRNAARGYFFIFTPFARWLLNKPVLAKTLWPLAKGVVYEELRVSGRRLPFKLSAWLTHWIGHSVCSIVGRLPVPGYVTDPVIISIAKQNNILFQVKE